MPRRVVILRDGPLHVLRCERPCRRDGRDEWCMSEGLRNGERPICWLGASMTEIGARKIAERAGYEVVG